MQKKLLSLVLMLIVSINTFAYYDFTVDGIRYRILSEEKRTCAVIGHEELTNSTLIIPTSVTNGNDTKYAVESIASNAFKDCSGLTSVTIPESVTYIGEKAFCGCSGLTSITIQEGVRIIGERAFYGCSGLTSITIPGSVEHIKAEAFDKCENLSTAIIKYRGVSISLRDRCLTSIKKLILNRVFTKPDNESPFSENLKIVEIGDSLHHIWSNQFYGFSGLTSIKIPESVTSIGKRAFWMCKGLKSFNIPRNITKIGKGAFAGSGLLSIEIPEGFTTIEDCTFTNCRSLKSVSLPNSLKTIGKMEKDPYVFANGVFRGCESLQTITIPSNVSEIGCLTFCDCI